MMKHIVHAVRLDNWGIQPKQLVEITVI